MKRVCLGLFLCGLAMVLMPVLVAYGHDVSPINPEHKKEHRAGVDMVAWQAYEVQADFVTTDAFERPSDFIRSIDSIRGRNSEEADLSVSAVDSIRATDSANGQEVSDPSKARQQGAFGKDRDTEVVEVTNPKTGLTWMDRNLGASRVAEQFDDEEAFGDLYQWGRPSDGHQKRTSGKRGELSATDRPGHGDFILSYAAPYDWRSPQNDELWQGVDGVNNPCPAGYRLPTNAEWESERKSWTSNTREGAFGSPLKLPAAGFHLSSGLMHYVGSRGGYWTSTVSGREARYLYFGNSTARMSDYRRANGNSVRCLKDEG